MAPIRPLRRRTPVNKANVVSRNDTFDMATFMTDLKKRTKPAPDPPRFRGINYKIPRSKPPMPSEMHPTVEAMYAKYNANGKKAPIDVRVRVFREAGYPEDRINDMVKSHEKRESMKEDLDKFTLDVFGPVANTKKVAPAKKKTLAQMLNIKPPKPPKMDDIGDDDDDE